MKKHIIKIALFSLCAAAFVATPMLSRADDSTTNAPAVKHHKHGAPFYGKLGAVDTNAMTLTVGKRTFQITSSTKITKDGEPATLSDGEVDKPVSGYYKTGDDGKLEAVTVHFDAKGKRHKKESSESSGSSTNSIN